MNPVHVHVRLPAPRRVASAVARELSDTLGCVTRPASRRATIAALALGYLAGRLERNTA